MAVKGKGFSLRDQGPKESDEEFEYPAPEPNPPTEEQQDQQELPGVTGEKQSTVQDKKFLAEYVRPHFTVEEDERYCALEFSFALTKEHKGKLPKGVEEAWRFVEKGGRKGVVGIDFPDQRIDVYLASDMNEAELTMGVVRIQKAAISTVKAIGKGASEKIIRLSFHAVAEATKNIYTFAATQFGNAVWIEMEQSQGELELP